MLGANLGDLKVSLKFAENALSPEADELIVKATGWRTNQVPRASLLTQTLTVPRLIDAISSNDPSSIAALKYDGKVQAFTSREALDLLERLRPVKAELETCAVHDLPRLNVTKKIDEGGVVKYRTRELRSSPWASSNQCCLR